MGSNEILVVGSVAFDDVETSHGKKTGLLGGSAVYFSLAASVLSKVTMVGAVGTDFDHKNFDVPRSRGIDTSGIEVVSGNTFYWSGHYLDDINTAVTRDVQLNVFGDFEPRLKPTQSGVGCCFLANSSPTVQLATLSQLQKDTLVVADTMNHWIDNAREPLDELVSKVDILILNNREALDYTSAANVPAATKALLDLGPNTVVIKNGEFGAYLATKEGAFACPSFPVEDVVDPTGAGDSFAGGFLGFISSRISKGKSIPLEDMRQAIAYGTVTASYTISQFGPEALLQLGRAQLDQRYDTLRRLTQFDGRKTSS